MDNSITKIFLEKNRSVLSNEVENHIDIDFDVKNKLLPDESLVDDFSLYEQYLKERNECSSYRIILNVNPVCSNVLFNSISEIVINEGSDSAVCLNFVDHVDKNEYAPNAINTSNITYRQAIRDTEYSHQKNGNFVYHCGIDIFNNHMLRKKIFSHINKTNYKENDTAFTVYNTINDFLRDNEGNIVKNNIGIKYDTGSDLSQNMHIYGTDSLDNLKNAFYAKCKESEGWWGFTNPGTINIPNNSGNEITINEMLANNKPCEFIDFYPDRSLFSFIPKYNKIRRRLENNWDYCITYPYRKDYDLINKICGGKHGEINARIKTVVNSNGIKLLQCTSLFKHSFVNGSYVNFYYYVPKDGTTPDFSNYKYVIKPLSDETNPEEPERGNEYSDEDLEFQLYQKEIRIYSTGDLNGSNKDRIFSVKYDDIKNIYNFFAAFGCYYKKVVNGCESDYYVRIFKKLKNINDESLINDVNKSAFATNIYGDDIAQIIFTDNVELQGLTNENGDNVSEIFFTAIKRNAGNEDWYIDRNITYPSVEFSHCFGVLTSGIDFSGVDVNEEPFDYNIHYLHNMDSGVCENNNIQAINTFSAWGETILNGMPKFIESGITIDNDEFYGDIVEFDVYQYQTNVIGNIFHRFNTMQRESFDRCFRDMYQDIIVHDDYDEKNLTDCAFTFTTKTYYCNDTINGLNDADNIQSDKSNLIYANIHPEGYYYNPHSRIKIKDYGEVRHSAADYVNYDDYELYVENEGIVLKVRIPVNYGFINGSCVAVYNKLTQDICWGIIKSFKDMYLTIYFEIGCFGNVDIFEHPEYFGPNNAERMFFMFYPKDNVPLHSKLCLSTKEFSWRNTLKISDLDNNNELKKQPFSNGCIYVQKNINFYLRRQDPYGEYGLSYPLFKTTQQFISNPMLKYIIYGSEKVDLSKHEYVLDKDLNTCY